MRPWIARLIAALGMLVAPFALVLWGHWLLLLVRANGHQPAHLASVARGFMDAGVPWAEALAWPVVAVVGILALRGPVSEFLLDRLKLLKFGDTLEVQTDTRKGVYGRKGGHR